MTDIQEKTTIVNRFSQKLSSCSISKEELRKLMDVLEERTLAAADLEIAFLEKSKQSDEQFKAAKNSIQQSFFINLTVVGIDGAEMYGRIKDVFESPNFPDELKSIYANNTSILKGAFNYSPRNSIELFLDFTKPAVFDFNILPSQATPNASNFTVSGLDTTWVNGIFNEIDRFFIKHKAKAVFLHQHTVYDLLVWILGLPFAFWVVYRISVHINTIFGSTSSFIRNMLYVYVFFIALTFLRILFHYARWIWPLVEFRSSQNRAMKHRLLLAGICTSIVVKILWEIIASLAK